MSEPTNARPAMCRTCGRYITHETRTEPGFLPRIGWYDDKRTDPLVCFRAIDFRHTPASHAEVSP